MEEDNKLPPYQRLQAILSENDDPILTKKANDNINNLLQLEDKQSVGVFASIVNFFKRIDRFIFKRGQKMTNIFQRRS